MVQNNLEQLPKMSFSKEGGLTSCTPSLSILRAPSSLCKPHRWMASAEFSNSQGCIDDAGRRHGSRSLATFLMPQTSWRVTSEKYFRLRRTLFDTNIEDTLLPIRSCKESDYLLLILYLFAAFSFPCLVVFLSFPVPTNCISE